MPKIIALQIDPIESLNYRNDSSLFIAREFQRRGCSIFYYTPNDMVLENDDVYAMGWFVELFDKRPYFKILKKSKISLSTVDLVLLRQDPPFDMNYITSTYLLDRVSKSTKVINNPSAVRNNVEKLMIYDFPEYILPSIVTYEQGSLLEFFKSHKRVIIKPLYGHGGKGVELAETLPKFSKLLHYYISNKIPFVVQKFCESIKTEGDKRVIIINGKVAGVLSKKAKKGKIATNIAAGGIASVSKLNRREALICEQVGEYLKAKDIFLAGIDIVDGYLLEINITSPTMLKMYYDLTGEDLSKVFCDELLV